MMDFETFSQLAKAYPAVPVYRIVLADLLTPVSAYMRLSQAYNPAILLESVEGGRQFTRYSYVCVNPREQLDNAAGRTTLKNGDGTQILDQPLLQYIKENLAGYSVPALPEVPSFCGGWVGYLGYETVTWSEDIPVHQAAEGDLPDAVMLLFETIMAFDHLKNEIVVCHTTRIDSSRPLKDQYDAAMALVDQVGDALHADIDYQTKAAAGNGEIASNFSLKEFKSAVDKAREHIYAGDVFQLVLSQRFERATAAEPITIYRALRNINPSPYMFCYQLGEFTIIGASPELLVKVDDSVMTVRPIAGTRPRGKDAREDGRLAEDLLSDEKELAEHLMLVDLGRNDVGRVSEFNSINIQDFMKVEYYSHVMHLVSGIRGQLAKGNDIFQALTSGFPAGTVTGAPKIRAMELINELEPDRRGIYSGALGYFDFHG
ncbi:MAG: chorismate-binding protein, partial [Candidatus Marinimicrobia bacterium]|nr:chorismate-binding protein [Candidatus Neomarinimicrobiota bacterium]